jgi:hypothetical protein
VRCRYCDCGFDLELTLGIVQTHFVADHGSDRVRLKLEVRR